MVDAAAIAMSPRQTPHIAGLLIIPKEPAGAESINHVKGDDCQVTTRIIQSTSVAGN